MTADISIKCIITVILYEKKILSGLLRCQSPHQFQRQREDDGGIFLCGNGSECLQISELQSTRRLADDVRCFLQGKGCVLLSFSCDDLGSCFSGSFCFCSHSSLQLQWQPYIFTENKNNIYWLFSMCHYLTNKVATIHQYLDRLIWY